MARRKTKAKGGSESPGQAAKPQVPVVRHWSQPSLNMNDTSPPPPELPSKVGSPEVLRPRSYQIEMYEESLRRNIIVAIDTGGGKTHIAVLRIQAELERCRADQLVWFLAPTVTLCQQQYEVLRTALPAVQVRLLLGSDNVEFWGKQSIWDAALLNIRIVVSTHDVLLGALTHGFVSMSKIALLVFDEAHHCMGSHPANRIMQQFYNVADPNSNSRSRPHILGLTASPIVNTKMSGLQTVEKNLNAISRSPKVYRAEMLRHVHQPVLEKVLYIAPVSRDYLGKCPNLQRLLAVYESLDINEDPYIISLRQNPSQNSLDQLVRSIERRDTYCQKQLSRLCGKAMHVMEELGPWAAEFYLSSSIKRLRKNSAEDNDVLVDLTDAEKAYLLRKLAMIDTSSVTEEPENIDAQVSPKVKSLVELLSREHCATFAGIIFAQQRATVALLSHLLSILPATRYLFNCGSFVGSSTGDQRRSNNIGDLADLRNQNNHLEEFKSGKKSLIIATSVLEEGIDVSACHLVVCFNKPGNLKSFIQRRGRARRSSSKYALMLEESDSFAQLETWGEVEEALKKVYADDLRQIQKAQMLESMEEDGEREFRVPATGALLTLDNAVAHLNHFCNVLPASRYVDRRPQFTIVESPSNDNLRAEVILPISIDPAFRRATSASAWRTEKMAKKDAAFAAYLALYKGDLVNQNLLPVIEHNEENEALAEAIAKRPSHIDVAEQYDPLVGLSQAWASSTQLYHVIVSAQALDEDPISMNMFLPCEPPKVQDFVLHWNERVTFDVFASPTATLPLVESEVLQKRRATACLFASVFSTRMIKDQYDYPVLFEPLDIKDMEALDLENITCRLPAKQAIALAKALDRSHGIVHDTTRNNKGFILREIVTQRIDFLDDEYDESDWNGSEPVQEQTMLKVSRLPKRTDFMHPVGVEQAGTNTPAAMEIIPAVACTMDKVPWTCSMFTMLIPSIMHKYEIYMVAEKLCDTIFKKRLFKNLNLVVTAISASSAREMTDYQQMEFLGDSILKFCTSVHLMARNPNWPEGFLSSVKDRYVSNYRLHRAAIDTGLDQFILTTPFTGYRWRPPLISERLFPKGEKRQMSTKVLADVVESLIGAAYLDGGMTRAIECISTFLPEMDWESLESRMHVHYETITLNMNMPTTMKILEEFLGHRFNKPVLLVEALTHPSFDGDVTATSYQRLEFLGDSLLDYIIVSALFEENPDLPHVRLHYIRTALANADFLAYLCMRPIIEETRYSIDEQQSRTKDRRERLFQPVETSVHHALWQYMRFSHPDISRSHKTVLANFKTLGPRIHSAIESGATYPWTLFCRLEADKFFSDIVESVLGAVYADSHGDMAACNRVAEKLGILPYLRRVVRDKVRVLHPKEELGMVANQEKVTYETGKGRKMQLADGSIRQDYWCKVKIGGREILTIDDGTSKAEVQTRAAELAIEAIKQTEEG